VTAFAKAGPVSIELLSRAGIHIFAIETPGWSLDFQLRDGDLKWLVSFMRTHANRAMFAECVAGSFLGQPVRLIQDDEFPDRLWFRISSEGQLADFPMFGPITRWFAEAVAELAYSEVM
jgi:hypothetical protein